MALRKISLDPTTYDDFRVNNSIHENAENSNEDIDYFHQKYIEIEISNEKKDKAIRTFNVNKIIRIVVSYYQLTYMSPKSKKYPLPFNFEKTDDQFLTKLNTFR